MAKSKVDGDFLVTRLSRLIDKWRLQASYKTGNDTIDAANHQILQQVIAEVQNAVKQSS